MKYLIAEDVCMVRKLLLKILAILGKGITVENGREALI